MKRRRHAARAASRSGFVLVTMLCCLVVLFAFLGLAIDSAYLEFVKTRMQTAADAAALGGAQEVLAGGAANVLAAARADAARNGFTHAVNGVTVTVNAPPATGYSTADSSAVEVVIAQQVPTFFMRVIGTSSAGLQVRAVAHLGDAGSCLHVLDPIADGALTITGSASVRMACGVEVASSSGSAFTANGNAALSAPFIDVHGGASVGNADVTPTPVTGAAVAGDPLSAIPAPSVGACDHTGVSVTGAESLTLPPGVYCNGISVSSTAQVTFSPGTYILEGGGLSVSGNSTVTGTGVTLYNTAAPGYSYGPVSITGNADVTLSAPTTGPLAGILFFQNRSITSGPATTFAGSATLSLTGALYFPGTHVDYTGDSSGTNPYSIIVARTITFKGNTTINNDYSSLPGGSPLKSAALISE